MGKRGPAPKPTALKKAQGTYRPDRAAANEAQPGKGARTPNAPAWLDETAKAIWQRHARRLWEAGLLTDVDVSALASLCEAEALYQTAVAMLAAGDTVLTNDKGYTYASPWVQIRSQALKQAQTLWREFGMTPSARSRIEVKPEEEEDEFAKLFGGSETVARKARKAG